MVWCSQHGLLAVPETERCVYVCVCVCSCMCVYMCDCDYTYGRVVKSWLGIGGGKCVEQFSLLLQCSPINMCNTPLPEVKKLS